MKWTVTKHELRLTQIRYFKILYCCQYKKINYHPFPAPPQFPVFQDVLKVLLASLTFD